MSGRRRRLAVLALAALVAALLAAPPAAVGAGVPGPPRKARPVITGKKKLLLFAKNPATWQIVKGKGTGKIVYRPATGAFSLEAAGLSPRFAYALIRYAEAPPKVEILARGTSDARGRLALSGVWRNWTKKFWLVAAEDVRGTTGEAGTMTAWRPERYLFEEKELGIPCDCPEPDEP